MSSLHHCFGLFVLENLSTQVSLAQMTQRKVCYVHFTTRQMKYQWLLRDRSEYTCHMPQWIPLRHIDKYTGKVDIELLSGGWYGWDSDQIVRNSVITTC